MATNHHDFFMVNRYLIPSHRNYNLLLSNRRVPSAKLCLFSNYTSIMQKKRNLSLILTEILICRLDRGIFLCLLWWLVISFLHLNSTSKSIADTNYWQIIWTDVNVLSSEIPYMSANISTDSWMRIAQIVIHCWSTQSNVCESMRLFNGNCISLLCYFYWIVEPNCRFYGISNLYITLMAYANVKKFDFALRWIVSHITRTYFKETWKVS